MGEVSIIAIDLAKHVFQLHGACSDGVPARAAAEPPTGLRHAGRRSGFLTTAVAQSRRRWRPEGSPRPTAAFFRRSSMHGFRKIRAADFTRREVAAGAIGHRGSVVPVNWQVADYPHFIQLVNDI